MNRSPDPRSSIEPPAVLGASERSSVPVHGLVERHAESNPQQTALRFGDDAWTYAALNRRANQVAHRLCQEGLGPEDPVGVHVDRSPQLVASLLGTLKAGAAYVALPPSLAPDRLQFMAEDAGVDAVLTADPDAALPDPEHRTIDVTASGLASEPEDAPSVDVRDEHLAYILYTSGTTGRPKGVMQSHRALRHHAQVFADEIGQIGADRTVLFKSSYTFDLSISELFSALIRGACVAVAPPAARGVRQLVQTIQAHAVTDVFVTPTRLRLLMDREDFRACGSVERVYSAGEALSGDVRDTFLQQVDAELYNLYGTTEMCCGQTGLNCAEEAGSAAVTSIGRPWPGYDAHVVAPDGTTVADGTAGELVVSGAGEARGYRGRPRETALRFVPDARSDRPGRRAYRSGDRARWTAEGRLEYLGREDDQLQIRGVRIETSEVEATLEEAEGVDLAAVRPLNERSGKADGLVAYIVPANGPAPDETALRDWGETHLPDPAVPRTVRVLDEMPLQPSGKIDYAALPDPETITDRREDRVPPQTELQTAVASIWTSHLDLDRVGIHENFFRIGGHSLLAVRIQHDIADELGAEVPLETFLNAPTIADLADAIDPQSDPQRAPIEPHEYGDEAPLLASQRRMWLLQTLNPDSVAYNVPATIRLNRHVDLDAFRRALTRLVERHEVLRTTFPKQGDTPVQNIQPAPDPVPWTVEDVTAAQDPEAEAQALIDRRLQTPFDLTDETPLRLSLIKVSEDTWLFCPLFHHIAIDEWTFGVLLDDLQALYEVERVRKSDAEPLVLSESRQADAWQDAHDVLHRELSPDTVDDPTLNTIGWVSSYDEEPFSEAEMRDWLQGRIDRLQQLDLGRTLEIGSGTGMLLFRLAPQADEYVGMDFSKQSLEYVDAVRDALDADYSNVSLVHGRADEAQGLDGQFDTILLNSVVQYFPDQSYLDAVLHAAAEKLRAPGTLYLGDVRDRRLAYAFHADAQRAQMSANQTRSALRDRAQTAFTQDDELLVDPQSIAQFARALPGITGLDFTLPPAEHWTEMSAFRYGALLHARPEAAPRRPDDVIAWDEAASLSALRDRLAEHNGSVLVTGIPNARVWEPLHLQHWLHADAEAASLSAFSPPTGDDALDPDALRRLGQTTDHRVTVSPSTDPAGRTFDAVFEPRSDDLSAQRPLTPLSAEASSVPVPTPASPRSAAVPEGPTVALWKHVLDQTDPDHLSGRDPAAAGPDALPIQYADYALWQQERLQGPEYEDALNDWVDQLDGVSKRLDWPFDGFDREREFGPAKTVELDLDDEVGAALRACADRQNTTLSVVFLGLFGLLLSRYTRQQDLTVGMPVTNRNRPGLDQLVGMLLNTLPFPIQIDRSLGFDAFVERLGREWRAAMTRNWVPFEDIVEAVGAERVDQLPLFDVMFTYVPAGRREGRLGTLGEVERDPIGFNLPEALCPLFLIATEQDEGFRLRFRYDTHRFDEATVRRMTTHFEQLLTSALADPDAPLRTLDLLPADEREQLSEAWAKGARIDVPDPPVHRLVEEKAATHTDRTAIVGDDETWTYDDLNRRANRLAHRLIEDGVEPGDPVGVHMDRSASLIAALLGVLKAGGAYVSLPPSLPDRRLQYMAQDAGVDQTVVDGPTQTDIEGTSIDLNTLSPRQYPDANPSVEVYPQQLAYILYTSGTTGRPKGVMISHAAITDLLIVMKTHFPVGKNDAILLKTPYSFDVSVSEIFNPLVAGARLVMTPTGAEKNPQYLVDRIQDTGASVLRMTPTELSNLLQADGADACDSIRRVFAAGEALTPAVRDAFHDAWDDAELFNLWGPTEACVYGSWWPSRADSDADQIPIGWPLSNTSLFSLDEAMDLVPTGAQGELYTAGPGLARGYRGRPRKTAEAYRPNPYADTPGARMYKTGDLVRWAEDGHLHFLGRKDNQIQLRGIRIELGEIEATLEEAPGIQHAAVRPFEGDDGRVESLVAYVVPEAAHDLDAQALRAHLGEYLPTSVLPGRYVKISDMPRSPAGKIDREGLPEPEKHVRTAEDADLQTGAERLIASIWRDVLDLEQVTRHGNFFGFGGNSLAAVKVHRRLQRQFDKDIDLVHLFEHTTIAQLADFLDEPDVQKKAPDNPQRERGRTRRERLKQQRRRRADRDDE